MPNTIISEQHYELMGKILNNPGLKWRFLLIYLRSTLVSRPPFSYLLLQIWNLCLLAEVWSKQGFLRSAGFEKTFIKFILFVGAAQP